jgi:hypothetical protein
VVQPIKYTFYDEAAEMTPELWAALVDAQPRVMLPGASCKATVSLGIAAMYAQLRDWRHIFRGGATPE